MPELPEVETVRRSLAERLCGRKIERVRLLCGGLRFPFPEGFAENLCTRQVVAVHRWAKYLLIELDDGYFWLIHLGMSGQCRLDTCAIFAGKHDHVAVDFSDGLRLHYCDPRRFGMMDLLADPLEHSAFRHLGREAILTEGTHPLAAARGAVDAAYLQEQFQRRRSSVKSVLFDQRLIAGLGNIYINEILWLIGIDPRVMCHAVPPQLFAALASAIREILELAIAAGGSSLRDFADTDGKLGYFQQSWRVYGRDGKPCCKSGCRGVIVRENQNGRSSFRCPDHQVLFAP